jgi:pimeloyl-ACP methyl ester carboxylesterase
VFATDLRQQVTDLNLPVYFFHGSHDYTVSYSLARDYFEQLRAPSKGFYTFEQSAHSPMCEGPKKCCVFCRRTYWQARKIWLTTKSQHLSI